MLAHTGDMYGGTWATPTDLKVQVFNSAYPYYDFVDYGFNAWNYTTSSSKLWMKEIMWDADDTDAGYQFKVRGVALGEDGACADAQNYTRTWLGTYKACFSGDTDLCGDVTYSHSQIRINTDTFDSEGTDDNRNTAMAHEFGHSLGLKHPDHEIDAIMNPYPYDFLEPQQHDSDVIKAKYGE